MILMSSYILTRCLTILFACRIIWVHLLRDPGVAQPRARRAVILSVLKIEVTFFNAGYVSVVAYCFPSVVILLVVGRTGAPVLV